MFLLCSCWGYESIAANVNVIVRIGATDGLPSRETEDV